MHCVVSHQASYGHINNRTSSVANATSRSSRHILLSDSKYSQMPAHQWTHPSPLRSQHYVLGSLVVLLLLFRHKILSRWIVTRIDVPDHRSLAHRQACFGDACEFFPFDLGTIQLSWPSILVTSRCAPRSSAHVAWLVSDSHLLQRYLLCHKVEALDNFFFSLKLWRSAHATPHTDCSFSFGLTCFNFCGNSPLLRHLTFVVDARSHVIVVLTKKHTTSTGSQGRAQGRPIAAWRLKAVVILKAPTISTWNFSGSLLKTRFETHGHNINVSN